MSNPRHEYVPAFTTTHDGVVRNVRQLAIEHDCSIDTLRKGFKEAGFPAEIDDAFIYQFARKRVATSLDGVEMRRVDIAEKMQVGPKTVLKLVREMGMALTSEMFPKKLVRMRGKGKAATVSAPTVMARRGVALDPGWWERKHLAHAGKNGFCKVEVVNESCLGMLGPMPIMGDMP